MWAEDHLPWVKPFDVDEDGRQAMNIDERMSGILAELELAHIYIERQQEQIAELMTRIDALEKKQ